MGALISSCFGSSDSPELVTPDMETRRQQQREAAEKRAKANESRGIKNIDKVNQQKIHSEEVAKRMAKAEKLGNDGEPVLRWQAN